jgi:hypothetical protein
MLIIPISYNVQFLSISSRLAKILVKLCIELTISNDHILAFKTEGESTPFQLKVVVTHHLGCLLIYRVGKHYFHSILLPSDE